MALIQCPECNNTVSNIATACPSCGAPVAVAASEQRAVGTPVSTIQVTSKRLKKELILSSIVVLAGIGVIIIAFVLAKISSGTSSHVGFIVGVPVFLIGAVWYFVTKLKIWWHHK